jgi:hypothetical protein
MCHFKGMGFSAQFPSPKLMQDFKLLDFGHFWFAGRL